MNRKILIQVTAPAVVIGLLLFGTCLVGARYLSRLQENRAKIVKDHLRSLKAALELEIHVRQLRYHSFMLYLIDDSAPEKVKADRLRAIEERHQAFEQSLQQARDLTNTAAEWKCIRLIEEGYTKYHAELAKLRAEANHKEPRKIDLQNLQEVEDTHPILHVVEPCREYFRLNEVSIDQTNQDSDRLNQQMHLGMLFLGLGGPISGLIIGYGMARGLSRSIYQLRVRVQDITQRLDQNVASVSLAADGDLHGLDQQLQKVVQRVAEVTERLQEQQREMLRAQQLSAVGQLAAGVAHEVRNPLTSVKLLVEAALRARDGRALSLDDLEVIHGEVLRLEQTVQGLLDFARPPAPRRAVCDLKELAAQAADLVRPHARQQEVEMVINAPGTPLPADVDRGQLRTVLVNLFLNSLDAMPHGGRLEVDLEAAPEPRRGAAADVHCLRVKDTGGGIPADMFPRLFTPFASSKPTGTGLGLSICQRIVEEHGGRITAVNRPEGGACFTITLPAIGVSGQRSAVREDCLLAPEP